jgi:hypothetical protein
MPITMRFAENGYVCHIIHSDPWSVDELIALQAQQLKHMDSVNHKVHFLINLTHANRAPENVWHIRSASAFRHPNYGHFIFVGLAPIPLKIAKMLMRFTRFTEASFFEFEEDAWAHVRRLIAEEG